MKATTNSGNHKQTLMKEVSLQDVAKQMRNLDFCMMITRDGRNTLHSRPMSNNGEVEYDGDSWFFSYDNSNKAKHIEQNPKTMLVFQTDDMLFLEVYGTASIIHTKKLIEEKWLPDLERWFPEGTETPGICLIKVTAERIQFWGKAGDGIYRK